MTEKFTKKENSQHIKRMTLCAVFSAIICVLSVISIPVGAIPVSLGLLAVIFTAVVLDPISAFISVAVYLILGAVGVPVFAGFRSGIDALIGPTGGYLWSYPFTALLISFFTKLIMNDNAKRFDVVLIALSCAAGVVLCYLCGTVHYTLYAHIPFVEALKICVLPFIAFDAIKCIIAAILGKKLREIMRKF